MYFLSPPFLLVLPVCVLASRRGSYDCSHNDAAYLTLSLYPGQWTNMGNRFSISKRRARAPEGAHCDASCRFIRGFIFFPFPFPSRSLPFSFLSSFSSSPFVSSFRALPRRPFLSLSLSLSLSLPLSLSLSLAISPAFRFRFSHVDVYSSRCGYKHARSTRRRARARILCQKCNSTTSSFCNALHHREHNSDYTIR